MFIPLSCVRGKEKKNKLKIKYFYSIQTAKMPIYLISFCIIPAMVMFYISCKYGCIFNVILYKTKPNRMFMSLV